MLFRSIALDNYKLINEIKNEKNIKIICKNLQYREAILEFLEKNKNIDLIFISEKLPGQISIEKLIKRIKQINNKINIIFFLEKENMKKETELKKMGIKNIYKKEKINLNNSNNNSKIKEAKIITIEGKLKSGKTTVTNLISKYLIEKNKRILLINLNKKTENKYLKILGKKYSKTNNNEKNIFINMRNNEIKINKNLKYLNNFYKIIEENTKENFKNFVEKYSHLYDYILIDIGNTCRDSIKKLLIENSYKNLTIIDQNFLGKKEIEEFKQRYKNGLHIVNNKYHFGSISNTLIKSILGRDVKCYKIFYNINFRKNIYRNKNLKIDNKTKRQLDKIFELEKENKKINKKVNSEN